MSAAEFVDRATGKGRRRVHYDVTIDGVPGTFTDRAGETLPVSPAIDGRAMLVSFEESPVTLDRRQRVQTGGGAVVKLQDRDGALQALFAVRGRRVTYIAVNLTAVATTVTVSSTTSLPSSGVVYVAAETIAYSGKLGPTLTGCTRGAHGSRAQAHRGDATAGAGVFAAPPSWIGRRVRVVGYFDGDDGVRDSASATELGVFRLEESPTPDGVGGWELRCSHLSDELMKRKLGSGLLSVATPGGVAGYTSAETLTFAVPAGTGTLFTQRSTALGRTSMLVEFDGISSILDITGVVGDVVTCSIYPRTAADIGVIAHVGDTDIARLTFASVKNMCLLGGGVPYILALAALTSINGDGTNGSFDVLPGVEPTTLGGPGFRFGAGIPSAEVDTVSMTATASIVPSTWSYPIDAEIPVADFLADFCRASNTAAVFSRAGQMTFAPLVERRATSVATITEAHCFGSITSTIIEDETYARVEVSCNYDPFEGEYEGTVTVIDEDIAATYAPRENTLVIESRTIVVDPVDIGGDGSLVRPSVSIDEIGLDLRREMVAHRGGALVITAKLSAKHCLLNLGDLVTLLMPSVSDRRGGLITSAQGRIIERANEWRSGDLSITVSVLVEERLSHFAPHALITSVDVPFGSLQAVILSTTDIGGDVTPTRSFRVGDVLTVVSSDGLTVEIGYAEIDSISTDTKMFLKAGPVGDALPLVAGEFLLLRSTIVSTPSADGFSEDEYTYHDGASLLTSATSRWR